MKYYSTRNCDKQYSFAEVVLQGLAPDGGLLVPASLPSLTPSALNGQSYQAVAEQLFTPFMAPDFSVTEVAALVAQSYRNFTVADVVQSKELKDCTVLELFHGPTLAFKDIALQFLGRVLNELLQQHDEHCVVLGATSGDTGGAAIAALDHMARCQVFMLYPKGRVSLVQEAQMNRRVGDNIFPLELEGSFDDAQHLVKATFSDPDFRRAVKLTAVNSINWCRVMAQMTYYAHAVKGRERPSQGAVSFAVPTGNFGDVLAGYYVQRMGFPIDKFIVACNENDLIARFSATGVYRPNPSLATLSPAMDIQVASNFERLLFELCGRDSDYINTKMEQLRLNGEFSVEPEILAKFHQSFEVYAISNDETAAIMRETAADGYLVDPHTAVGIAARRRSALPDVIALATAHPLKFSELVTQVTGQALPLTPALESLVEQPKRCFTLVNQQSKLQEFILSRCQ